MKILGMSLYPNRKTDEEYITSIRKLVGRSKWFALFHFCAFVFFLGAFWWVWRMIYSVDSLFADLPGTMEQGAFIGVMLGAFAGVQLLTAAQNAMWAGRYLCGLRTERLMLRFYDELNRGGQNFQPITYHRRNE